MSLKLLFVFLLSASLVKAQQFREVEDWLKKNTPDMGGRSVLVIYKDGKLVYSRAVNDMSPRQKMATRLMARRSGKEADTDDFSLTSRQPVASCSKWFSAALVMSFVDEGKLRLTDTVGKFLPILSKNGKGDITISQCLSHLTAIKAPSLRESLDDMRNLSTMDEAVEAIARLPMEGKPGGVFHYSNVGLQLAGAVIEKISGKSFETLFEERIAGPLQMNHTDFGKAKVPLPAGGASSTPEDYLHFLEMILHRGNFRGRQILSEKSVREMQINRLDATVRVAYSPAEAGSFGYGFGEWVMESASAAHPAPAVTSPGLFGSFPWVNYEKGYAAFLMTYNIRSEGRNERYRELKGLVDKAVSE